MMRTRTSPSEAQLRDGVASDALITGRRHLVFGGQVDPELHHVEGATTTGEPGSGTRRA